MITSITICILACAGLIACVLIKPSVTIKGRSFSVYWLPPLIGGLLLIALGKLPAKEAWQGLTSAGSINPLKILALFISLTFLSVYLDELGFFKKLAAIALKKAGGSCMKLFFILYAVVSVLTVFTSNDIVVLTFTPFICCFCKAQKISPVPYLVGEFVAANTWSMTLVIGNPTNIYLAATSGLKFGEYFAVMWLPTLLAGLAALGGLLLLFRKQLCATVSPVENNVIIMDKGLLAVGVAHLGLCIVCLAVSSYIKMQMWAVAVGFAVSLCVCTLVYSLVTCHTFSAFRPVKHSLKRAPWALVPFVLSMFFIVLTLGRYGVTQDIAFILKGGGGIVKYGVSSYFAANVINNIPMSVLFGEVLNVGGGSAGCVYATVIGSNLGAYLTPIGALAGIMWTGLLKTYGVKLSFRKFMMYGAALSVPALAAALFGLWVIL